MLARIIAITEPVISEDGIRGAFYDTLMTVEEFLAYVARVSNPANQNNTLTAPKLLKYLVKNKHWSPFEMVHLVQEINTTRDIGRQILRHRSFSFQEFSQRYADPKGLSVSVFTAKEARLQDTKNRQNSLEINDENLQEEWTEKQWKVAHMAQETYEWAIEKGIAKEQARAVMPEGLTPTRMYMGGTLRSWIHYCDLRMTSGTQKEHREIAKEAWNNVIEYFPSLEELIMGEGIGNEENRYGTKDDDVK